MTTEYIELIKRYPDAFLGTAKDTPLRILTSEEDICRLEKQLGKECGILYSDDFVLLLRDAVIFPDGTPGTYVRIVPRVPESAVVILPMQGANILLLLHYRHSLRRYLWEFPRGFGEFGLTAEQNAVKEMQEETSAKLLELECLGQIHPDSGLQSTQASVFLARLSENCNFRNVDTQEVISEHRLITPTSLKEMIQSDQITDAFTLSAITLAVVKGKLVL